ncbi:TIGR01212 family radical SAM protein [PVC group bacterium (ex Bugula neritina AB1)]|nr:TIGR01212 family radical SAM protein [PVC group bacterium (ex Bugula neritina AB1)]
MLKDSLPALVPQHFSDKKRYYDFSTYLKRRFGCKVYKVVIDAGFTCPNRDGFVAKGGCIYCNANGSGSGKRKTSVREQVLQGIDFVKKRYKAKKIMVYFQAFTNTYAPVDELEKIYKEALCHPDIVSIAIGTRPDCIDRTKLEMINQFVSDYEVWMEYGLESSHDRTLTLINRMDTLAQFEKAVKLTRDYDMKICTHLIMGLPYETYADMMLTVDRVARLDLNGIKIHNLYIENNTSLKKFYDDYGFELLSKEAYVNIVCDSLEKLSDQMVIERLNGDPVKQHTYLPDWSLDKQGILMDIDKELERRNTFQGQKYKATNT